MLENVWSRRAWHGLQRVRVIHGDGAVLRQVVRQWCDEKGIEWNPERGNPGATIVHPGRRLATTPPAPYRPLSSLQSLKATEGKKGGREEGRTPAHPPAEEPTPALSQSKIENPKSKMDLMAAEFERLGREDALTTFKRKRDLLPQNPLQPLKEPQHLPALPESEPDLMAQEFHRLGQLDRNSTRRAKRSGE